jgi:hypothetical protein
MIAIDCVDETQREAFEGGSGMHLKKVDPGLAARQLPRVRAQLIRKTEVQAAADHQPPLVSGHHHRHEERARHADAAL